MSSRKSRIGKYRAALKNTQGRPGRMLVGSKDGKPNVGPTMAAGPVGHRYEERRGSGGMSAREMDAALGRLTPEEVLAAWERLAEIAGRYGGRG